MFPFFLGMNTATGTRGRALRRFREQNASATLELHPGTWFIVFSFSGAVDSSLCNPEDLRSRQKEPNARRRDRVRRVETLSLEKWSKGQGTAGLHKRRLRESVRADFHDATL